MTGEMQVGYALAAISILRAENEMPRAEHHHGNQERLIGAVLDYIFIAAQSLREILLNEFPTPASCIGAKGLCNIILGR
jgi:hypothetical protein